MRYADEFLKNVYKALSEPETVFVVLNPKDYVDHVMLHLTKENYEPETGRNSLFIGFMGTYTDKGRGSNPRCAIYVRREVDLGLILSGKAGDNPLEPIVPRGFAKIPNPSEKVAPKLLYVVEALRGGDRENHSYVVGVWEDFDAAKKVADEHAEYRGGKYVCQVLQTPLNGPMATDWNETVLYETRGAR